MNRRDIAIRTFAAALLSLAAAWAWSRLMGPIPTATRILPSVVIVAVACGFGTAGGRHVARGAGVLMGLAATFACGLILGAMTLEDSTGDISPSAFLRGVIEGLGILLTSPVPAPANAETVTATIVFSGYVTAVACVLACTRAPATALIPTFLLFIGATALSQGSIASPMISGVIFTAAALIMLALVPKSGKRGAITDGVAFAEAERDASPGRYIFGVTVSVFIAVISVSALAITNATGFGEKADPFDPHRSSNHRPRTDINPVNQVQSWQTVARSAQTQLFTAVGTDLTTALWWATAESYNGQDWISRKTYSLTDSTVPYGGPAVPLTRPVVGRVTTTSKMEGPWLPTVHCVNTLTGPPIRSNQECDVITRSENAASTTYAYTSRTLAPRSKDQLTQASIADPNLATTANELPTNFPPLLAEFAEGAMPDDQTPWNQLQGLNTSLSLDEFQVSTSSQNNPFGYQAINDFVIESKLGTQAQYATAFALMARYKGFSTRLATGFRLATPRGGAVTSRQAIVWPEVKLTKVGWVPFAPGPTAAKTGVPVPQFFAPKPAPKPKPEPPAPQPEPPAPPEPQSSGVPTAVVATGGVVAVAALWVLLVAVWRRRTRRRLTTKPLPGTFGPWTWMRAARRHVRAPLPVSPGSVLSSISENASTSENMVPDAGLVELASLTEPALYGPGDTPPDVQTRAWTLSDADSSHILRQSGLRGRMRWWLVPLRIAKKDAGAASRRAPTTMGEATGR